MFHWIVVFVGLLISGCVAGSGEDMATSRSHKFCEDLSKKDSGFKDNYKRQGGSNYTNEELYHYFHGCVQNGLLPVIDANVSVEKEVDQNDPALRPDYMSALLENTNIWYSTTNESGESIISMNLYNLTAYSFSYLSLGFSAKECEPIVYDTEWEMALAVGLEREIQSGEQAVAQWVMPEEHEISSGCLTITGIYKLTGRGHVHDGFMSEIPANKR
ncbi:hypothetical protein [Ruegeria marina]|uniref:Lipoprotein n=1 Tax=Ruegeria marina TaxID=639004 RepID=A0A1G7DA84_9RHOB|nr:hypothetical protein [Ruegeria marina]SDE48423.1 hypothetical protein SAMN04488239_12068 [Ruegeria marina]